MKKKKIVLQPVLTKKGIEALKKDGLPNLCDFACEDWERMKNEKCDNPLPLDWTINAYLKFFNI